MNTLNTLLKLTCYNCGKTIGIAKLNSPMETEEYNFNKIIYNEANLEIKFYCPECILLEREK